MPDWTFPLLYILIVSLVFYTFLNLAGYIWGSLIGLLLGHMVATFILSRLPGFWGDK